MNRSSFTDVAKAFIAKGKHGHALATVFLLACVMIVGTIGGVIGVGKLPEIVASITAKPASPPAHLK